MDAWLIVPLMITVHHQFKLKRGTHLANRNVYTAHLDIDILTNLGPTLQKLVPDKLQRYQSSNLGLKLEPLTTAHIGSAKCFFKDLGIVEVVKICNGIRANYLQCVKTLETIV